MTFLYINSFIGCRKRNVDGSEMPGAKNCPEAFWKSIESMAKEMGMSKGTINQCLEYLTTSSSSHPALLVKKQAWHYQSDESKPPKKAPNIYVLNKDGYEKEASWALQKVLQSSNGQIPVIGK